METPDIRAWLPVAKASDNKYTRGVLAVVAGSEQYPGAALLTIGAALQCRIGMVEYLGPAPVAELVLLKYPEVVIGSSRATAQVLGPGVSTQATSQRSEIEERLCASQVPTVIDAGGLEVLSAMILPGQVPAGTRLLTPHRGEAERMATTLQISQPGELSDGELAGQLASATECTVLLKGSISEIATPGGLSASSGPAPTALAVAGSGDVLAGVLGAMLALRGALGLGLSEHELLQLALSGLALHTAAAEHALKRGEHGSSALVAAIGQLLTETDGAR